MFPRSLARYRSSDGTNLSSGAMNCGSRALHLRSGEMNRGSCAMYLGSGAMHRCSSAMNLGSGELYLCSGEVSDRWGAVVERVSPRPVGTHMRHLG